MKKKFILFFEKKKYLKKEKISKEGYIEGLILIVGVMLIITTFFARINKAYETTCNCRSDIYATLDKII